MKHIIETYLSMFAGVSATTSGAHAAKTTVVNFGGANGGAREAVFNKPFEAQTGNKVTVIEYDDEQAKIKVMVKVKHVSWDVVEVESGDIGRGCDEGLFEKLGWNRIAEKTDLVPEVPQTCGVGSFVWFTTLAYNAGKFKTAPKGWADLWDVKTFPGKRGARKDTRYDLEFALMVDSVSVKDVYKVLVTKDGQNCVFKKPDRPKPNTQWWEADAQPSQFLVTGDVVISTVSDGRIDAAQREGKNLEVVWNDSICDPGYWAIPKGSPNRALAEQYIAYTLSQRPQQEYAKRIAHGSANVVITKALDAKTQASMPNSPENSKSIVLQNLQFWTDHGDELEQRSASWASKQTYSDITQQPRECLAGSARHPPGVFPQ